MNWRESVGTQAALEEPTVGDVPLCTGDSVPKDELPLGTCGSGDFQAHLSSAGSGEGWRKGTTLFYM